MFCAPHTAGFSGSCPVSENLTYGHSSRGVAGTKVLFILHPHSHLPWGPQMVWGVKLATLLSHPPSPTPTPTPPFPRQTCRPQLPSVSTGNFLYGKLGVFKPWSALQILKCDNRATRVFQRHWGRVSCLTTAGVCLLFNLTQRKRNISTNVDQKITFMTISQLFPQFVWKSAPVATFDGTLLGC